MRMTITISVVTSWNIITTSRLRVRILDTASSGSPIIINSKRRKRKKRQDKEKQRPTTVALLRRSNRRRTLLKGERKNGQTHIKPAQIEVRPLQALQ